MFLYAHHYAVFWGLGRGQALFIVSVTRGTFVVFLVSITAVLLLRKSPFRTFLCLRRILCCFSGLIVSVVWMAPIKTCFCDIWWKDCKKKKEFTKLNYTKVWLYITDLCYMILLKLSPLRENIADLTYNSTGRRIHQEFLFFSVHFGGGVHLQAMVSLPSPVTYFVKCRHKQASNYMLDLYFEIFTSWMSR